MAMVRTAHAKLNLFLHLNGKRADGYHLLESLVGFTAFGDEVALQEAPNMEYVVRGPWAAALDADTPNLIQKAAEALHALLPDAPAVELALDKHIPVSAGLGGGSVDAAAVMHLLQDHWQLKLEDDFAQRIALQLGADVPVAYAGTPTIMRGIGEILEKQNIFPQGGILLINPRVAVPTADIFRGFDGSWSAPLTQRLPAWSDMKSMATWLKEHTRNDLEATAARLFPAVAEVLDYLHAQPQALLTRMSGSGGTCFALFETWEEAHIIHETLTMQRPEWWSVATGWKG